MMRAMIIALTVLAVELAIGQETPPNLKLPPPEQSDPKVVVFELPKSLTTAQLINILSLTRIGYYDPMVVRQAIISRGDAIVSLLKGILTPDSLVAQRPTDGSAADTMSRGIPVQPEMCLGYAVGCLDAIGTEKSFQVLLGVAASHPDPNVRGGAVVAIGSSLRDQVCAGKMKADPEVVHLLMMCVDDSSEATSHQMKVGDLARQALAAWTGIELGPMDESVKSLAVGKQKQIMTLKEYREYWWKRVGPELTWADGEGRFRASR
jgi:hypothetical protein